MADDYTKGKVIHENHLGGASGGSKSGGENSGPTGSSRHYPKKAPGSTHPDKTDWNPMKKPASTYGINGCGC